MSPNVLVGKPLVVFIADEISQRSILKLINYNKARNTAKWNLRLVPRNLKPLDVTLL
jgi:hypothetical protein